MNRLTLALFTLFTLALAGCGPTKSPIGAEAAAKKFVLEQLKSPASAKFSNVTAISTDPLVGRYIVVGQVDAQNSYGALLRNNFTSEVKWMDAPREFEEISTTVTAP